MSTGPAPAPDWKTLAGNPWARRIGVALLLTVVNVAVYREAMDRFFNADQLHYFAERGGDSGFWSGLKYGDNASRQYWKGDELLFRPLSGVVLAAETAVFEVHYRAWNWTNLLLHLGVALILFEVLWSLQPSVLAAAFAVVFSLLTANFELVAWNHLAFYLVGYGCLLLALQAAWRLAREEPGSGRGPMIQYVVATAGAMSCHEIAVIAGVLMPVVVVWSNPRLRRPATLALLLLPLLLYSGLYVGHVLRCERWLWTAPYKGARTASFPVRVALTLGVWGGKALNPWSADFEFHNFTRFDWSKKTGAATLLASWSAGVLLLGALGFSVRRGLTRERARSAGSFAALLLGLLAAYSAMNNFGRSYAADVTYYVYFFALLGAVLLYSLVDVARVQRRDLAAALVILGAMGAAQAWRTREASRDLAALNAPVSEFFDELERFVAAHRAEPGFAFAVRAPDDVDPSYGVTKGYPDHPEDGAATISAFMYPRYFDLRIFKTGPDPSRHRYLVEWSPPKPK